MKIKTLLFCILYISVLFLSPFFKSIAITLDKTSYYEGDPMIAEFGGGIGVIYDLNNKDIPFAQAQNYPDGFDFNYFSPLSGSYSIMEFDVDDHPDCMGGNLSYDDCKASTIFMGEFLFNIYPVPVDGGASGNVEEENTDAGGLYWSYLPEVSILSPKKSVFSKEMVVDYIVSDKNDNGPQTEKDSFGLGLKPVSIFYSDKIDEWNHAFISDDLKMPIAKDLPAVGTYKWSTKDLIPGIFYRVIVDAMDLAKGIGEDVSDFFTVDFNSPVFTLKTDYSDDKDGVKIVLDSSKDLFSLPKVTVTQRGAPPVDVVMDGEGSHYEGVYKIIKGYDGNAKITVVGSDIAGNSSSDIVGGGSFNIGIDAPPKPKIFFPENNSVSKDERISVSGQAREDTTVFLSINGTDVTSVKPDKDGNFRFETIKLKKDKNLGVNFINVYSKDQNGNTSEENTINVKYNLNPSVSILTPTDRKTISGQETITTKSSDENLDPLLFTYQVISAKDYLVSTTSGWTSLVVDSPVSRFVWDTTEVDDGQYIIRALVSDGYSIATSTSVNVSVKNILPFFRFEDGRRTVTNKNQVSVVGKAMVPDDISPRPTISLVEYSSDNGKKWVKVSSVKGLFSEEKFSVNLKDLVEGVYPVLFRVKDSRGFSNKSTHFVVVDKTSPESPNIVYPRNNLVITDELDEDRVKTGLQVTIKGNSESGSNIVLFLDGVTKVLKARPDGVISFRDITVLKKGEHKLVVHSEDDAGNKSKDVVVSFVYNNPIKINLTNPRDGRGVGEKATLSWVTDDPDSSSKAGVDLSYRKGQQPFILLSKNNKNGKFLWDTSDLEEGDNYELNLSANDGISTSTVYRYFSIDHTLPTISDFTLKQSIYNKKSNFSATGLAEDVGSGVEFVEYAFRSVDGGSREMSSTTPWYKAKIKNGLLSNKTSFYVDSPISLLDGKYEVVFRSVDAGGNISSEKRQDIVVDSEPPRVGSFEIYSDSTKFLPDNNVFFVVRDATFSIKLSLESKTKSAYIEFDKKHFPLTKDLATGLWTTDFSFDKTGPAVVSISAVDDRGNELVEKKLANFDVKDMGRVLYIDSDGLEKGVAGAKVIVSEVDKKSSIFSFFRSVKKNILESDSSGFYKIILTPGEYKITVNKEGFSSKEFEYTSSSGLHFVTEDVVMDSIVGSPSLLDKVMHMLQLK